MTMTASDEMKTNAVESNDSIPESVDDELDSTAQDDASDDGGTKLVPVQEAIRYRKRAQAAERELEALRGELADVSARLEDTSHTIATLEQRDALNRLLVQEGAIDLDATRVLAEDLLSQSEQPDVEQAVRSLHSTKPFLFAPDQSHEGRMNGRAVRSGAVRPSQTDRAPTLRRAAQAAVMSGRQTDLLNYMRLKRGRST